MESELVSRERQNQSSVEALQVQMTKVEKKLDDLQFQQNKQPTLPQPLNLDPLFHTLNNTLHAQFAQITNQIQQQKQLTDNLQTQLQAL